MNYSIQIHCEFKLMYRKLSIMMTIPYVIRKQYLFDGSITMRNAMYDMELRTNNSWNLSNLLFLVVVLDDVFIQRNAKLLPTFPHPWMTTHKTGKWLLQLFIYPPECIAENYLDICVPL